MTIIWPSAPMTLTIFLSVTGFLVTVFADCFTMLDGIIIISYPQLTALDYLLCMVVIEELWDFWDFLRDDRQFDKE